MDSAVQPIRSGNLETDFPPEEVIFGVSPAMVEIRRIIQRAAGVNVPVLLTGESGTGKDLIARMFHEYSAGRSGSFVKVNCPAIPGNLLESELFGYERGAFTGAFAVKPGRIEQANGGTLFLDEISELDYDLQAKILQLLQDGTYMRIGGQEMRQTRTRLVCATNRDLHAEVGQGTFRQDLYYRIAVITVRTPPLRERISDLPVIADYFVRTYSERYNTKTKPLPASVMNEMLRYHWPGNIRELQNLVRRYVILGTPDSILTELCAPPKDGISLDVEFDGQLSLRKVTRDAVRKLEAKLILKVLKANNWNRRKTAKALKISYRALLYKIREAGLPSRTQTSSQAGQTPPGAPVTSDHPQP
ncbi:MAG: sigma-54 interaction domain-containing protein [Acidobacteriaceae bacterium]